MDLSALKNSPHGKTITFVAAALIAGAVGSKLLWTDGPTKASAMTFKSAPAASKAPAAAKKTASAAAEKSAKPDQSANPESELAKPAPVASAPVAAPRPAPREVDSSSDTEGLFLISTLQDAHATAPAPANPQDKPAAAPTYTETNNALAERVVNSSAPQASATDGLGPVFVDDTNGYYMRFPTGWSIRRYEGAPWVIDCGDGKNALISIGFSAFPAEYTADNIPLDWVARRIKKRADTTLNSQGYATIMNRKALWSKSTGPMQMGGTSGTVVRTTYILPLGDGRVAEIRIAAAPQQYEKIAPLMKNSVSTFRLVKRKPAGETPVAKTE